MPAPRPLISLVAACYNVEGYLPDLLASLDRELAAVEPIARVEVIFVVDGATDGTAAELQRWRRARESRPDRHPPVVIIEQPNVGVSAARNRGLEVATGEWISFPDADDALGRGYLKEVASFLLSTRVDGVALVATNLVTVTGSIRAVTDDHALRWRFRSGTRVVCLRDNPDHLHLTTNTAFVRLDEVRTARLSFDGRIRPTFEDASLVAQILLRHDAPRIGLLPKARYLYRRRSDSSSLVQSSWSHPGKYESVLRHGYLALLRAAERDGHVPRWLANTVLSELVWYFIQDLRVHTETASLSGAQITTFHALLDEVLSHIDAEAITEYRSTAMPPEVRAALLARKGALPAPPILRRGPVDRDQQLTRVAFWTPTGSTGPEDLEYRVDGAVVVPVHAKRRTVSYLGRTAMEEAIAWLPGTGTVTACLDGQDIAVTSSGGAGILEQFSPNTPKARAIADLVVWSLRLARHDRPRLLRLLAGADTSLLARSNAKQVRRRFSTRFRDCWLFMDRDTEAHDNAEHLYRYVHERRPDINAWFVLSRTSPDWQRLSDEGFRLIPYGSLTQALALAHCRELISSQIDHYVVSPPAAVWLRRRTWRFTWLQHGVIQSDLSRWLNTKAVSTVVATTPAEHDSMALDGPYLWTTKEMVLTGQPRHDALLRKAADVQPSDRNQVVFMPTWRRGLLDDVAGVGNARTPASGFWESDYVRNWLGLVSSPVVCEAAERQGLSITFMPHPNMGPHLSADHLPPHVGIATYADNDVQDVLATASHVVTDYSSIAFDAALIDRPVLYFQFDRDEFLGGRHIGRPGYFDYERDGFGPVVKDLATAEVELAAMIHAGKEPAEPYAARILSTFTLRDGKACERIVDAIEGARLPRVFSHHIDDRGGIGAAPTA